VFNKVEKKSKRKESHHHFNEEAKCVRCGITISEVQSVFCREKNMLNDYLEAGGDEDCIVISRKEFEDKLLDREREENNYLHLNLHVKMPRELDKGDWNGKVSAYLSLQGITYLGSSEVAEKGESYGELVDYMNLVGEVEELREQYLEIEERLKELGKTTKRVQTFVSKLNSKDSGEEE
jgi:hypothetical protein